MSVALREHIKTEENARITRPSAGGEFVCEVSAFRFMDVAIHPVPGEEMVERFGSHSPGGRIMIAWPSDPTGWFNVAPGDQIEIDGRTYPILGVEDSPVCYGEVFVDQAR